MLRNLITDRLFDIYSGEGQAQLQKLSAIVNPEAECLADIFYSSMLELPDSHVFLDNQIVSDRLHRSMAEWIRRLFMPMNEESVNEYIEWQQIVGDVHARINIPMRLVNHGIRILKIEIDQLINASNLTDIEKLDLNMAANYLLHFASSLMNESYVGNQVANERDAQALRFHLMSFPVVIELERLRSTLFDWYRKSVTNLYESLSTQKPKISEMSASEFGLWVTYKAELIFSDQPELVENLKGLLAEIELKIKKINELPDGFRHRTLSARIEVLNESVSKMAWFLTDLSNQALEQEAGRDALTRLFNRRFLPAVMQATIRASTMNSIPFAVLICDLDKFKEVNDQFGHKVGDQLLISFGQFLLRQTRATDYVFRMGGDEFLLLLIGTNKEEAQRVARKILTNLKVFSFNPENGVELKIQSSIGIAVFDGHPDYERAIKRADDALYQAKKSGKKSYSLMN